ncbi:MAG: polyprenol monophosphomannose synthase [Microbacteriaceae bacterium]
MAKLPESIRRPSQSIAGSTRIVVMPTFNEIDIVEKMVARIRVAVPEAHLLIVDDTSPDGTGKLADTIALKDDHVTVLHRKKKNGLGRAYLEGFEVAIDRGFDFIAQIDADGSHDPEELPAMFVFAENGADLVIGSRWVKGGSIANWPWIREAISRAGNTYARVALGSGIHDLTAGFRVFSADMLKSLHLEDVSSQGYCFQVELAWKVERVGGEIIEHPITFVERSTGYSKMHVGIVFEALLRVTAWGFTRRFATQLTASKR